MDLGAYRPVLANRDTRQALLLGFLIRVPMWAGAVILTLHVVTSLGRSYGEAGLVTAASTVAVAVSGPWRGRLLDRIGLRRTVGPSLVVQAVCWSIAPWVGYAPLIAFAALAGLFVVPTFSILRQVIIRSVPSDQRRTALSLDSSATELSFMAGPAIGVWLATSWDTGWALLVCELTSVAAGFVLWLVNPPLTSESAESEPGRDTTGEQVAGDEPGEAARAEAIAASSAGGGADVVTPGRAIRGFITFPVAAVYLAAACSTLVLSGTDVSIVAALRTFEATGSIGWVLGPLGRGFARRWPALRRLAPFLLGLLAARRPCRHHRARRPRRRGAELRRAHHRVGLPLRPDDHGHRRAAEPPGARTVPRGDDGLARVGDDRRLGGGRPGRGVRHRPRRLAVGVRRRLRARCRHRGGGPRRLARRPAAGRPDRPPPIRSTGPRLLT